MAENAILYDSSKCSACKGCQVQCKQWNNMPSSLGKDENEYTGSYQSMSDLNGDTRLLIQFDEKDTDRGIEWAFGRRACFHCTDAACATVCPAGAITKLDDGTVKLDASKCIGCKYCTAACPFEVPKFRQSVGVTNKCTLCDDRTAMGREPACVQTCPAAALSYGPREDMVAAGKARIEELKTAGFDKAELYGADEMGGMHVLQVAKYGLEAHGYLRDPKPGAAIKLFEVLRPLTAVGVAGMAGILGISFLSSIGYKRDDSASTPVPDTTKRDDVVAFSTKEDN
ncbi:MAG: 4Fe-4S ferredoxin [Actinobacteria bacterium HGW-Actinobacteria-9]|jgi:formate dehydrogenase iron-sulfur subunit|nr:MAG: 4Fe-4S ferredoxin [Actinobacteria bacterium HGW-Actinobacteria-9]